MVYNMMGERSIPYINDEAADMIMGYTQRSASNDTGDDTGNTVNDDTSNTGNGSSNTGNGSSNTVDDIGNTVSDMGNTVSDMGNTVNDIGRYASSYVSHLEVDGSEFGGFDDTESYNPSMEGMRSSEINPNGEGEPSHYSLPFTPWSTSVTPWSTSNNTGESRFDTPNYADPHNRLDSRGMTSSAVPSTTTSGSQLDATSHSTGSDRPWCCRRCALNKDFQFHLPQDLACKKCGTLRHAPLNNSLEHIVCRRDKHVSINSIDAKMCGNSGCTQRLPMHPQTTRLYPEMHTRREKVYLVSSSPEEKWLCRACHTLQKEKYILCQGSRNKCTGVRYRDGLWVIKPGMDPA